MINQTNFCDQLLAAIESNQTLLYLALDPDPESFPASLSLTGEETQSFVTDLLEKAKCAIDQTADLICACKITLGTQLPNLNRTVIKGTTDKRLPIRADG
jgi:hypothetical protein